MTASSEAVGTWAGLQLEGVFQSPLPPIQVTVAAPVASEAEATKQSATSFFNGLNLIFNLHVS